MTVCGPNPWWHPSDDDLGWDEPLPRVIVLGPDYSASLPLWGENGNVAWQDTEFPPELLDRLAAWQQEFDNNFHYDTGWRSADIRDHWDHAAKDLATDVRAALGSRAELIVDLWPLKEKPRAVSRSNEAGVGGPSLSSREIPRMTA